MSSAIQQILVHLDPTRAAARRLSAAREVAQRLGAQLTALYAATPGFVELPYAPNLGPGLAASLLEIDDRRRQQAQKVFDETMKSAGPEARATWAQTSQVPINDTFARQALFADLVVLGQHDLADEEAAAVPADFVETVLLTSGKPGLVIPHIGANGPIGKTVAIAWKETPESARAVAAAMPFLRGAEHVYVMAWGEDRQPEIDGQALDLERYLHAHGVDFTWDRTGAEKQQVGELLLSRAFDFGADLLVMGCYGHSRAREWIMGGASRTILQSMTLPVLMVH